VSLTSTRRCVAAQHTLNYAHATTESNFMLTSAYLTFLM
jgi:hypothetical protein